MQEHPLRGNIVTLAYKTNKQTPTPAQTRENNPTSFFQSLFLGCRLFCPPKNASDSILSGEKGASDLSDRSEE